MKKFCNSYMSRFSITEKILMREKSIGIITCWFGPFPWYFRYFLKSCKFNDSVSFIIITDNDKRGYILPHNVRLINFTLDKIECLFSIRLNLEVHIRHPYKLCDFKPAYGFLFSDILRHFDFWGYSDLDIIYGNIRDFITAEVLSFYDVISCRHDYVTGSFCLFRNNNTINSLFMKSRDWKTVFCGEENFCFDECNYLFRELNEGHSIFEFPDRIQSMTYVVRFYEKLNLIRCYFDFIIIEGIPGKIRFDKGKIIYKNKYECLFYHLIKFKTICQVPRNLEEIPDAFYFTSSRILKK